MLKKEFDRTTSNCIILKSMPATWLPMKYILSYCGCMQNKTENVEMTNECKWISVCVV